MQVVIAAVGAPPRGPLGDAIREYEARATRYFRLRVIEVPPAPAGSGPAGRRREAEALLARIPERMERWALTRGGSALSSRRLADHLGELAAYGLPGAAFLIGGPEGLPEDVLAAAGRRLSLSALTVTHDLARLLLAEQIYRAGTILRGEPYHRE